MFANSLRALVGFAVTIGMWAFFAIILPVAVMIVTRYVVRLSPLVGRRSKSHRATGVPGRIKQARHSHVMEAMDRVCVELGDQVDPFVKTAAHRVLKDTDW